ncbi:MAG: cell division protein ZapA [Lachnospiraceae bacterium]|nr:cell division protein ZapA [Lachnospiraceae bacterium]
MAYKNMVSVRVCGKTMTLSGNESVEYITKVANYIEDKAEELRSSESSKNLSPNLVSVLTSINIADDYFKEITKNQTLMAELAAVKKEIPTEPVVAKTVADNLRALLDGIKAEGAKLKEENQTLKAELEKIAGHKNELDEKLKNNENLVNDLNEELKRKVAVIDQLTLLVQSRTFTNTEEKATEIVTGKNEESEKEIDNMVMPVEMTNDIGEEKIDETKNEEEAVTESLKNDAAVKQSQMQKSENYKQFSKKDEKRRHKHPHRR